MIEIENVVEKANERYISVLGSYHKKYLHLVLVYELHIFERTEKE